MPGDKQHFLKYLYIGTTVAGPSHRGAGMILPARTFFCELLRGDPHPCMYNFIDIDISYYQ